MYSVTATGTANLVIVFESQTLWFPGFSVHLHVRIFWALACIMVCQLHVLYFHCCLTQSKFVCLLCCQADAWWIGNGIYSSVNQQRIASDCLIHDKYLISQISSQLEYYKWMHNYGNRSFITGVAKRHAQVHLHAIIWNSTQQSHQAIQRKASTLVHMLQWISVHGAHVEHVLALEKQWILRTALIAAKAMARGIRVCIKNFKP